MITSLTCMNSENVRNSIYLLIRKFVSKPFCLFVDVCEKADKKIYVEYHFLFVTVFVNRKHCKSFFRLNGLHYLIDYLKAGFNKNMAKDLKLNYVFYYFR